MSVKVGDKVFVGPWTVKRNDEWDPGRFSAAIREDSGDALFCDGLLVADAIPDHPALIPVARWLAEHGEEMLADLVSAGAHEIGDAWNAEQFGDAAYREAVKRAGLALIAALEEGTR